MSPLAYTPWGWGELADALRSRYPDDWADRLQSYKDGTNPDLQRWRAIGGERYDPAEKPVPKAKPGRKPGYTPTPDPSLPARNRRIYDAHAAGVPMELLMERFGLRESTILHVVASFNQRASR